METCYEVRHLVGVAMAFGGFGAAAAFLLVMVIQGLQNRR